jgi:hypothetical protein
MASPPQGSGGGSGMCGRLMGGDPGVEVRVGVCIPLIVRLGIVLLVVLFGVLVVVIGLFVFIIWLLAFVVQFLVFVSFCLLGVVTLLLRVVTLLIGLGIVSLIFIAVCFVGGLPAIIGFVRMGFGGLTASRGSSGCRGGVRALLSPMYSCRIPKDS